MPKDRNSLDESVDNGIDIAKTATKAAGEIAKSVAKSTASAGGGAAKGAAAGTAAGAAAGPAGAAIGSAVGLAVGLFAKPVVKGLIVIFVIIFGVFTALPSMLFENPIDMLDNSGPTEVFNNYKELTLGMYKLDLDRVKEEIELKHSLIYAAEKSNYDEVYITTNFTETDEELYHRLNLSSIMILAMFEISTDDWKIAKFSDFQLYTLLSSVFLNVLDYEEQSVVTTVKQEERIYMDDDGHEKTEMVDVLYLDYTYSIKDLGIRNFAGLFLLDEKDYMKAIEMTYYLIDFFGEEYDSPKGGTSGGGTIVLPGGTTATYPGGGTHNFIRKALDDLENPVDFYGGSPIIPIQSYSYISSRYGPRDYPPDPIHTGLDFAAGEGTPIYSAMDGEILAILQNQRSYGNHVVVYHGGRVTTMYAHMSRFGAFQVGDKVQAGDIIGYVGTTGLSDGNHLHFEYQVYGSTHNPESYLPPV